MELTIDYNAQMLNRYPEVIKQILEFRALIKTQSLEVEEIHEELDNILKNNYFGEIEVIRGKNLCNPSLAEGNGSTITIKDDVLILPTGKVYGVYFTSFVNQLIVGETYTFSVESISNHGEYWGWRFKFADGTWMETSNSLTKTLTISQPVVGVYFYVGFPLTSDVETIITKPQIELGSVVTEYEHYVEPYSNEEYNIQRWERFLGINPSPQGEDDLKTWLSDRQETILARLYNVEKLNSKSISEVVKIFTGGVAKSYFKDGTIHVLISPPEKQYKFENVEQELRNKIPAHLMLNVAPNYRTWQDLKNNNSTWQDVKNNYNTWEDVLFIVNI